MMIVCLHMVSTCIGLCLTMCAGTGARCGVRPDLAGPGPSPGARPGAGGGQDPQIWGSGQDPGNPGFRPKFRISGVRPDPGVRRDPDFRARPPDPRKTPISGGPGKPLIDHFLIPKRDLSPPLIRGVLKNRFRIPGKKAFFWVFPEIDQKSGFSGISRISADFGIFPKKPEKSRFSGPRTGPGTPPPARVWGPKIRLFSGPGHQAAPGPPLGRGTRGPGHPGRPHGPPWGAGPGPRSGVLAPGRRHLAT
jgi:hypothetical protein